MGRDWAYIDQSGDLNAFHGLRRYSYKPVMLYGMGIPKAVEINALSAGADGVLGIPDADDVLQARLSAFFRRAGFT